MEEKKLVPKLRFPGFTEPWEQRKLGELYKPRREKNDGRFGKDKIISVANMYFKNDVKLATSEYLLTYNVFLLGDIAFEGHCNNSFSYGRFVENSIGDGIVSHVFDVLMPNTKCCINYWKVFINYEPIMGKILRRCTNSSRMMANLELKAFLKETINIPTIKEQQKIGNFLEQFDQYITLHQRKLEHLKLKKKSLLQKLFPKEGEVYPELRFPGFTDPWEQRKLGEDILSIHTGTNILGSETNDGIPLLKMGNLRNGYFDFSKLEYLPRNIDIDKQDIIKYGDFLFNTRNTLELVGKGATWTMESKKFAFNGNIARFDLKSDIDTIFFNYLYNTSIIMRQIHARATGTTSVAAIYTNTLNNLIYRLPIKDEQTKIGNFFQQLDSLITLHQRKLEHLQLLKKALLQQLFV